MKNAMESILNKSTNWFKATGSLYESYSLVKNNTTKKFEHCPMFIEKTTRDEYIDGKKTGKTIPCEKIWGGIILKTKDGVCEFQVSFTSKNADGSDNKKWAMAKKMVDWNPTIGGDSEKPVSYVTVSGSVNNYDSYSENKKEVYSNLQWGVSTKCEHAECVEDEEGIDNSGCTLHVIGFLVKKNWEPDRNNPEETTGRIKATLMLGGNRGECFPVEVVVDEELAEAFDESFEASETLDCVFDRIVKTVGGNTKKSNGGLSKKKGPSQNLNSGFTVEELVLNSVVPIEEPDELTTEDENGNEIEVKTQWINPKTMKAAMKIRQEKLDELKSNGGKKSSTIFESLSQSKKSLSKKNKVEDFEDVIDEDNDLPFDDDDFDF